MPTPFEEANQDHERENHEALMDRERYEESQFDEEQSKKPAPAVNESVVSPDPEITKVVGHAFQGGESIFDIAKAIFLAIPDTFRVKQLSDELLNLVPIKSK